MSRGLLIRTTMSNRQKKTRVRYTVVIEVDEDKHTEAFSEKLSREMLEVLRVNGCTFIVGATNEIFTVTRLDRLL